MTVLRSGSASDVGRVRAVNEDLALESLTLFAVADGMGGHAGGEIAARTAIDALKSEFGRKPSIDGLVDAVHEANQAVWDRGHADPDLLGMGTTLTAAALVATDEGDRLVLANVGDSRAYRFHGSGLEQLTTDHSVAEELVARGELSEAEAAIHPHRHILTRALGVAPDIDVDVWQVVPEEGDRFLLCSDGLTNEVPTEEITRVLSEYRDPEAAAEALVRMANEAGGSDNITVVVLDVVVGEHLDTSGGDGSSTFVASPEGGTSDGDGPGASGDTVPSTTASAVATVEAQPEAPSAQQAKELSPNGMGTALVGRTAAETQAKPRPARPPQPPRPRGSRRITFRVLLFLIILGGVVFGGYSLVHWYVNGSYFVGLNHGQVVIYQGRPGGFVGIKPRVVYRSQLTKQEVPSYKVSDLRPGVQEPSLRAAHDYVNGLLQAACSSQSPPANVTCPPVSASNSPSPTSTLGLAVVRRVVPVPVA